MSKFILVYYGTDYDMDMLGEYATKQDAFNAMIENIKSIYTPLDDMSKFNPNDDDGMCNCAAEGNGELYWGEDWANCYQYNDGYSDHYKIFEI